MRNQIRVSTSELEAWLHRTPVIGEVHPLVPLALETDVQLVSDPEELLARLDSRDCHLLSSLLALSPAPELAERFPTIHVLGAPPVDAINRNMGLHMDYARTFLLNTRTVAERIVSDVARRQYDVVVLMLVDGLSYDDVLGWPAEITPCFVDGPSVTYRLNGDGRVVPTVGFPAIINSPTVFARLYELGYRNAIGFTYWQPEDNVVAETMFAGIPTHRVANFEAILGSLGRLPIRPLSYIQIVREGLDGLAHGKRELARPEIEGALAAIRNDIERLIAILRSRVRRGCLYAVADHGILWKTEHQWRLIESPGSRPRFTSQSPAPDSKLPVVRFECDTLSYFSFRYPYLGNHIPVNDSGVHGGLSYQESIVPFAKFEV